jgi:phosphosulfolactate synthase (CoM biosynthesis protein A)
MRTVEAPTTDFLHLSGLPPDEVISVETLRLGLRGDTLLHFR